MDTGSVDVTRVDWGPALATLEAEKTRRLAGTKMPRPRVLKKAEWPPNYNQIRAWRAIELAKYSEDPIRLEKARAYYRTHPVEFIVHWCDTYDPRKLARGEPVRMPFVLFQRQAEMVDFLFECLKHESGGLIEKARDMGATWVGCAFSVWLWLFWAGSATGWGSNKQEKVDRLGDPSSIFEKMRMMIEWIPDCFKPEVNRQDHLFHTRCLNPDTGATIVGEIGDNIGRGGRTLMYFVDEAAHLEHPEQAEASLSETTRVRIDLSSVSGLGTVFWRKRQAGEVWTPGYVFKPGVSPVFIFDWSDHPEKTEEWHDTRKKEFADKGLAHVFARETDRDYAAAVEGIIIPAEWVRASIDAHKILGWDENDGRWWAALDVADAGLDRNAFAKRRGPILRLLQEWGERDTGATTRRAIAGCQETVPIELHYDAVGVGSGVKAEANRLADDGKLPKGVKLVPWFASAHVLNPHEHVIKRDNGRDDPESPKNKDFYQNLKAQAWWQARLRFERTFRAIKLGIKFPADDLISLPSDLPLIRKLQEELSQAVTKPSTTLKLMVDKAPEGASSPNLADAVIMCYWPWFGSLQPKLASVAPIIVTGVED